MSESCHVPSKVDFLVGCRFATKDDNNKDDNDDDN